MLIITIKEGICEYIEQMLLNNLLFISQILIQNNDDIEEYGMIEAIRIKWDDSQYWEKLDIVRFALFNLYAQRNVIFCCSFDEIGCMMKDDDHKFFYSFLLKETQQDYLEIIYENIAESSFIDDVQDEADAKSFEAPDYEALYDDD